MVELQFLQINKHFECSSDIEDIGRVTEVIFRHRESFDKYNRCHGKNKPPKFFGSPFLVGIFQYCDENSYCRVILNWWIFQLRQESRETELLPDKTMLPDSAVVERSFIEPGASYEAFTFL